MPLPNVIPAKAGIQSPWREKGEKNPMDPRFRGVKKMGMADKEDGDVSFFIGMTDKKIKGQINSPISNILVNPSSSLLSLKKQKA
ncbi:hypothetical protein H5U35_10830 [Candidatus Aerophobetes bacterium]|nr:hypothetical protein [Candidatus Aerophobetes bacterium]